MKLRNGKKLVLEARELEAWGAFEPSGEDA